MVRSNDKMLFMILCVCVLYREGEGHPVTAAWYHDPQYTTPYDSQFDTYNDDLMFEEHNYYYDYMPVTTVAYVNSDWNSMHLEPHINTDNYPYHQKNRRMSSALQNYFTEAMRRTNDKVNRMRNGLIRHSGTTAMYSSSGSNDEPETGYANKRVILRNENNFGYKDELSSDTRRTKSHRPTEKNMEDTSYVKGPRIILPERQVFATTGSITKVQTTEPPFSDDVTKTTPARLQEVVTAMPTDRDSTVPSDWPSGRKFGLPITSEGIRYVGGIMSSLLRRIQET